MCSLVCSSSNWVCDFVSCVLVAVCFLVVLHARKLFLRSSILLLNLVLTVCLSLLDSTLHTLSTPSAWRRAASEFLSLHLVAVTLPCADFTSSLASITASSKQHHLTLCVNVAGLRELSFGARLVEWMSSASQLLLCLASIGTSEVIASGHRSCCAIAKLRA